MRKPNAGRSEKKRKKAQEGKNETTGLESGKKSREKKVTKKVSARQTLIGGILEPYKS